MEMEPSAFRKTYNQICCRLPTNHMLKFDFAKDSWPVSQPCFLDQPDKLSPISLSPEDVFSLFFLYCSDWVNMLIWPQVHWFYPLSSLLYIVTFTLLHLYCILYFVTPLLYTPLLYIILCYTFTVYCQAVYCYPAYVTYMQSTSCKMPAGWTTSWNQDRWEKYQ